MESYNFIYKTEDNLHVIIIDDEFWFIGKEVAKLLGYKDLRYAMRDNVDKEDKQILKGGLSTHIEGVNIPNRGITIINEAGLYSMIFASNLEQAKRFKHWVTHEVLPSVRKTGQYVDTENKFEQICPIKFGKEELKNEMGKRINKIGGRNKGGLAYYYAYIKFGHIINFNFYRYCKKNDIKPIDWLRENNYYDRFCEFVCNQKI